MGTTLSIGDRAERVMGSIVSSNYFDALGIHPILGRGFDPSEEIGRNAHPVTVVSYWMWQQRYGRDPNVIGRMQMLNGVPHTIIGVAPEGFYGTFVGWPIQFWVPVSMEGTFEPGGYTLEDRSSQWVEGFVLLKPGVTSVQAQAELAALAARLENDFPETNRGHDIELVPLWKAPFNHAGEMFPRLGIALVVVFGVLLIACANVSNLLLVRAFARRQEISVRLAIGASRSRLVRQLLTEGLILASFAAAGAILVAYLCRNLMVLFFPSTNSFVTNMKGTMDWRVLVLSAAVSLVSTLLFGLIPALQTSNIDLAGSLKSESGAVFGGRGKAHVRSALVLVQVSLSFILLVGAVLLLESLRQIRIADPGFSTQNVLTTGVDLLAAGYDAQRAKTFQDDLLDRVRSLPGVESVALARVRPFSYQPFSSATIAVDGYVPAPDETPTVDYNQVSAGYFTTMGIPLASGRDFTRNDNENAPHVAIVNQKMAEEYWHSEDPVARRFQVKGEWLQVVGLAKQSKYNSFGEAPKPFFYVPLRQDFSIRTTLNIRTSLDPSVMAAVLTREIHLLDGNLAPSEVISMRRFINYTALASQQIVVALLGIFGALALLLAAIGLYGVMAYSVSQSTRELALRMALGAGRADMLRLVMGNCLALTAGGIALGAIAALGLTRLIGVALYKVSPYDPLAFSVAFAGMTLISLAACSLPASRAARIDPIRALRE
jgi:macrolide transport system ATP-binding/permease protein